MGTYINIGNAGFQSARNDEYVDKSPLIAVINDTLFKERRFSCVSRCRRFGKSMAAKMLCAYYDYSCDSRSLFADLKIASDKTFEQHLNKYPVIYLDMTNFVGEKESGIAANAQRKPELMIILVEAEDRACQQKRLGNVVEQPSSHVAYLYHLISHHGDAANYEQHRAGVLRDLKVFVIFHSI